MSSGRRVRVFGAMALAAACLAGQAAAVDPHRIGDSPPTEHLKRMGEQRKALESLDNSSVARGLYSTLSVWAPNYAKLRACFFGGSPEINDAIAKAAQAWITDDVGLKLDFGKPGKLRKCDPSGQRENQIRVSYDHEGYWSHIGQNAVVYVDQKEASLNLQAFDKMEPAKLGQGNERAIILHVFGHALGLLDEHQSAAGLCQSEFNWDYISSYFTDGTFIFPVEMGYFKTREGDDLVTTDFDPKSVMLEPFPEKFFLKGADSPCFVKQFNNDISVLDRAALAQMYPVNAASRREAFEKNRAALQTIITAAGEQGRKDVTADIMKAFFERKGTIDDPDDGQ